MRNTKLSLVIAAAVAVTLAGVTPASAVDNFFTGSNIDANWDANASWSLGHVPINSASEVIYFHPSNGTNSTININDANTTLPLVTVKFKDNNTGNWWIYDSDTLVPDGAPPTDNVTGFTIVSLGTTGTLADIVTASAAAQTMTFGTIDYDKKGNPRFYCPVVADTHYGPEDGFAKYYGPVTFTTDDIPRNNGYNSQQYFYGDYTATTKITGTNRGQKNEFYGVTNITTLTHKGGNIFFKSTASGTVASTTIGGAGAVATLTLEGADMVLTNVGVTLGGTLKPTVALATFPTMVTAGGFGLLQGDFTGGIYGTNITLNEDAVLAVTDGPADPTPAQLGLTPGNFDAVAWKGVTADGTFTYGDDNDSTFKGTAFGGFTSGGLAGKRLVAPVGAGDLEVAWLLGVATDQNVNNFYMDSLDQTGVANITMYGWFNPKGGTINQNPDANSVTTFNFTSNLSTTSTMFQGESGFTIRDDQTYNFAGSGTVNTDQDDVHGQLSFSGETMFKLTGTQFLPTATDPNVKLTFGAGTMLSFGSGDVLALEQLSPAQISVDPDAMLGLETSGGWWSGATPPVYSRQFDITDANNPNLVALMKKVNVVTYSNNNNYNMMQGDGIQLGDGKYLLHYGNTHKGLHMAADANFPNAMIHGAGPGTTMGIGVASGNGSEYLEVIIPIDAHGGTVLLNSTDTFTVASPNNNGRFTGVALRKLEMSGPIHNAAEVVVLNKGVKISNDGIDSGTLLGALLPIRVAGTGNLTFQHSADVDGFVVTALPKTQITIDQGGRVYVDGDMSVNTMVLNSTYSSGNDGLQINSSDDDLTITGRLSGDGAWGDDGQLVIGGAATISPGNSVGTLTGKNLTMANGAIYEWQIADATPGGEGTGWDLIDASGDITFDGAWTFKALDANSVGSGVTGHSYVVASASAITDFDLTKVTFDGDWTGTLAVDDDNNLVLSALSSGLIGDADENGVVNAADYMVLKRNMGGPGAGPTTGDFDTDNDVDFADLQLLIGNYDAVSGGAPAVPEPATLFVLLAAGLPALLKRRQRRS